MHLHTEERLCEHTARRQLPTSQEKSPHQKLNSDRTLIWTFQLPELKNINLCYLSHPVYGGFYGSLGRLRYDIQQKFTMKSTFKLTRECNYFWYLREKSRCILCRKPLCFYSYCVSIITFWQFEHLKCLISTHLLCFGNTFSRKIKTSWVVK